MALRVRPSQLTSRAVGRCLCTRPVGPLADYHAKVGRGQLRHDDCQAAALVHLEKLHNQLCDWTPWPPPPPLSPNEPASATASSAGRGGARARDDASQSSFLSSISSFFGGGGASSSESSGVARDPDLVGLEDVPRGVYMYGGVGVGKSLLMDSFCELAPLDPSRKRRVHFHEFMLDVHRRMHELRQKHPHLGDPMPYIANGISTTTTLLCFDEFQVTDVADALVMRRLFRYLFANGLVMVATSNRRPDQLYLNGIQRESFLPFIDDLEQRCYAHDLASGTDYRALATLTQSGCSTGTYLYPLNDETHAKVDDLFARLTKEQAKSHVLRLRGRELKVPSAANLVARFSFSELCGRPLGAEDYLGIAAAFHTVVVESVPQLSLNELNQVRRFITMIDAFYDQHTRLIITAQVAAEDLFVAERPSNHAPAGGGTTSVQPAQDEVFAFDRTLSRLKEMRSHKYLVRAATGGNRLASKEKRIPALLYEEGTAVSASEAAALFQSYDVDASGSLEPPEVRMLLEDLCERRRGHRNVTDEEVEHAISFMDSDGNGEVTLAEFTDFLSKTSNANIISYVDGIGISGPERLQAAGRISRQASPG